MKIKITYYNKLPYYIHFTPEQLRRFSVKDRMRLSQVGGVNLREIGFPVVEDNGTFYYVEEPA